MSGIADVLSLILRSLEQLERLRKRVESKKVILCYRKKGIFS